MNRVFVMAVICVLTSLPAGVTQKPPAASPHQAELGISILKFHDFCLQASIDEITFVRDALERLRKMPDKLTSLEPEKRKKFLKQVEEAHGIFPGPRQYKEEILPILFKQLRGEPLPQEGTRLQRSIIKRGGGQFDGMAREALHFINEKRDSLLTQQKKLREEIQQLEKQIPKKPGS